MIRLLKLGVELFSINYPVFGKKGLSDVTTQIIFWTIVALAGTGLIAYLIIRGSEDSGLLENKSTDAFATLPPTQGGQE